MYAIRSYYAIGVESNTVYEAVRRCLYHAGLDRERFGSTEWNPFHGLVRPGDFVLLKPNLVKEAHPRDPDGWKYVLTHGSIIRAVSDYVITSYSIHYTKLYEHWAGT